MIHSYSPYDHAIIPHISPRPVALRILRQIQRTTSSPAKGRHLHGRPAQEFGPVRSAHVGRGQRGAQREGQAKWGGHDLPKLCLRLEP